MIRESYGGQSPKKLCFWQHYIIRNHFIFAVIALMVLYGSVSYYGMNINWEYLRLRCLIWEVTGEWKKNYIMSFVIHTFCQIIWWWNHENENFCQMLTEDHLGELDVDWRTIKIYHKQDLRMNTRLQLMSELFYICVDFSVNLICKDFWILLRFLSIKICDILYEIILTRFW